MALAKTALEQSELNLSVVSEKLEKESKDKERYRLALESQKDDLKRQYEAEKVEAIAKLTKEFNSKMEEKNELILAEQERRADEDAEKRRRDE